MRFPARNSVRGAILIWLLSESQGESYRGLLDSPVDLYSADGIHLPPGRLEVEVRFENGHYLLLLGRNGRTEAALRALPASIAGDQSDFTIPLAGAAYLSGPQPVGHPSEVKTAPATTWFDLQRSWKGVLRLYKKRGSRREAVCVFQEKQPSGEWSRLTFRLLLEKPVPP